MKLQRTLKIKDSITNDTWSKLCKIESSLSFQDLMRCLLPHRQNFKKHANFKLTIAEQTFDQIVETLSEVVTREDKVILRQDQQSLIDGVNERPEMLEYWRSIDLILRIHKFSVEFQSSNHKLVKSSVEPIEMLNQGVIGSIENVPDLYLVSKLKIILSIYYVCLFGPSLNEERLKFIKRSIMMRRKIAEIWSEQTSLLYVQTILSFTLLKIIRTKGVKKDLQTRLIFYLRSDLSRQLKTSKDKYLSMINEEVSRFYHEYCNEPKIYNQGLLSCIRKVGGSLEVLNPTNKMLKSKKSDHKTVNKRPRGLSDRISAQLSRRSAGHQQSLKIFHETISGLKNRRSQASYRLAPGLKLDPLSDSFDINHYLLKERSFSIKYMIQRMLLNIEFSVQYKPVHHDQPASINCCVKIRNFSTPDLIVLHRKSSVNYQENSKDNPFGLIDRCLKMIFPMMSSGMYLPLLKNSTSSLDTLRYSTQQILRLLQITHYKQIDFFYHVRDLIILGLKTSLKFQGKKQQLVIRGEDRSKAMGQRDKKGRKIGLRLKKVDKLQEQNPERQIEKPQKIINEPLFEDQVDELKVEFNHYLTIEMLYNDEIKSNDTTSINTTIHFNRRCIKMQPIHRCTMQLVALHHKNIRRLQYTQYSTHYNKPQIAVPAYNTRIRLDDDIQGELVLLKLQMCTRLFIRLPQQHLLITQAKPCIFEQNPHLPTFNSAKFSYVNMVHFVRRLILRSQGYAIVSIYTHDVFKYVYEVYWPHSGQKAFTHSDQNIQQFKLSGDCLNGHTLVGVNHISDIRHHYCQAQMYVDYVVHYDIRTL